MQAEWSKALHGDRNVVGTREKAVVMEVKTMEMYLLKDQSDSRDTEPQTSSKHSCRPAFTWHQSDGPPHTC